MTESKILKINKIITNAINDGINLALERYAELKAENYDNLYLPKHEDFPSISSFSSGLPHFWTTPAYLGQKVSYEKILSDAKKDIELESWKTLSDFFLSDKEIYGYFQFKDWKPSEEERRKEIHSRLIFDDLRSIIDCVIHSVKNPKSNSKKKTEKISNWVNAITKDIVNYELVIPIIFHQPDCQKIALTNNIRIQKIEHKLQLSRHYKLPRNIVAHENVVGGATHAVYIANILKNIPNENKWKRNKIIEQRIDENFDLITKIFSIFRLAIDDSIGFCQVITKPIDFEDEWIAELPSVRIFGFKKYPPSFDDNGWHKKRTISKKQLLLIKKYYNQVSDDKKIKLAKRKLFDSDLRTNKEDSVLDIATGLETLLSDSTDNLKYKISLRSAAICKKKKLYQLTPVEVKAGIKIFYDFRSAIVHGNIKNLKKRKIIKLDRFEPIDTLWFGRSVLKHIIEFLVLNPEFRDVDEIDNSLLNEN